MKENNIINLSGINLMKVQKKIFLNLFFTFIHHHHRQPLLTNYMLRHDIFIAIKLQETSPLSILSFNHFQYFCNHKSKQKMFALQIWPNVYTFGSIHKWNPIKGGRRGMMDSYCLLVNLNYRHL